MKDTIIILVCLALAACVIAFLTALIIFKSGKKGLLDRIKPDLPKYKSYKGIMSADEKYPALIIAFKPWEIAVMNCEIKGTDFSVGKPKIYKDEDLAFIRISKMRRGIKLYDRQGSLAFAFEINGKSTKEVCGQFPIDLDFSDDINSFFDFIDKFQKRLEDRTNEVYNS